MNRKKRPKAGPKAWKKAKIKLDAFSAVKRNPTLGRPREMPHEWIIGRAPNYEFQLREVWDKLEQSLLAAENSDCVTKAFKEFAQYCADEFVPRLSDDILSLLRDPDFPKRAGPRIKFLARSLAGRPALSFRTSRDICEKAQKQEKLKSPHRILRREFYIECSCGYQGPALNNACRKCGAEAPVSLYQWIVQAPATPSSQRRKAKPSQEPGETFDKQEGKLE
jgi:hypothetical protein